jgi:hypothetical protein
MSTSINSEKAIAQVMSLVKSDKKSEIRLNANGGNSILIVCPPNLEGIFIADIYNLMDNNYTIIDLNILLVSFVEKNPSHIDEMFELLQGSVNQIFKAPEGETDPDLFSLIINEIDQALGNNKVPVIIHSGVLYGTGIDCIHIMENPLIMKSKLPLIILYPATLVGDQLMFLNSRPASKYRCMIVQ